MTLVHDERMQPPFFSVNAVLSIPLDKLSTLNATSGLSIGLPSEHGIPIVVFHPSGVKGIIQATLEVHSNVHAGIIAPINRLRLKRSPTMESPTCTTAGDPKQYLKAGEGAVIRGSKVGPPRTNPSFSLPPQMWRKWSGCQRRGSSFYGAFLRMVL